MTRWQEVEIKQQRLIKLMDEKGLDGILLKKQANFSWLTGGGLNVVNIATEMGMSTLLVTRQGRYVIANQIEAARMMEEEDLNGLGFQLLQYEWAVDREAELAKQVVGDLSKVGADGAFADCQNLDGEIKKCRYSLTENEIERYLFLGAKLSAAMEKVALGIRPGDRECEIAGRIGAELWKDRIDPSGFQVAADERAFLYRHAIPTQRMVKRYVMLCCNARYHGLITTITRIVHLGRPDPLLLEKYRHNCEIECRMMEASKPGTALAAVFETGLAAYRELGYPDEWLLHHQGGAMGYAARDIKVTAQSPELIQDNQAICWNPSISGVKTEDAFIATQQGALLISAPVIFPQLTMTVNQTKFVRPGMLVID